MPGSLWWAATVLVFSLKRDRGGREGCRASLQRCLPMMRHLGLSTAGTVLAWATSRWGCFPVILRWVGAVGGGVGETRELVAEPVLWAGRQRWSWSCHLRAGRWARVSGSEEKRSASLEDRGPLLLLVLRGGELACSMASRMPSLSLSASAGVAW